MRRAVAVLAATLAMSGCALLGGKPSLSDAQQVFERLKLPGTGAPSGVTIAGAVDRPDARYRSGEPIVLSVVVDKAASVAVLRVLRSGRTAMVFPDRSRPDAKVAAHSALRVQVTADQRGAELFELIGATDMPTAWPFTKKPAASASYVELGSTTRALATDLLTTFRGAKPGTVAASTVVVRVDEQP
jgi:hypothetical protein